MTYELGSNWIKCLVCMRVSYHPQDIDNLYCAHCHRFHTDFEQPEGAD